MRFHNEYDIESNLRQFQDDPTLGPACQTIANLRDCVNSCSDGWAYWQKPLKAAQRLMTLIDTARERERRGVWHGFYPADVIAAQAPIKAFLTREKLHDRCEIVRPSALVEA